MIEEWRPVVGFEGCYEVSDLGRVRSLDRAITYRNNYSGHLISVTKHVKGRMLRPGPSSTGHLTVALGRGKSRGVHTLVLWAFEGAPPKGMESLHRNGIPGDNKRSNLHWGTRRENILDAIAHGVKPLGEHFVGSKLKNSDIPFIRKLLLTEKPDKIALIYRVSGASIRQIKRGKCWKHIQEVAL